MAGTSLTCLYQRLLRGGYEAIVQARHYQGNDSIKMIMRRQFRTDALAKQWYNDNNEDIRKAFNTIPFSEGK